MKSSADFYFADPTVIPAHPGFRAVTFSLGGEDITFEGMEPDDLEAFSTPIIAWIVEPRERFKRSQAVADRKLKASSDPDF